MRSKLSVLAASAALALAAHAAIDLGNGVKVVPNAIVEVEFNDNLFLGSTNEQNETLTKFSPGILFGMGEGALNSAKFTYNEEFQFYSELSELNTSLSLVDFTSHYDDGKMKIDVDAWWHEANQATRDTALVSNLIKRDLLRGQIVDEVKWTDKSSVKVGVTYDSTDYSPAGYADWKWWEVPVNYYYEVMPKLDSSIGFRYKSNDLTNDLGGARDSDEYFYNVGLRGEITSKLTAEIAAGYQQLRPDSGDTEDGFGLDARLTLAVSPKSNLGLTAKNKFGYSGFGDVYRTGGIGGSFDTAISQSFSLRGSVYYDKYDYYETGRDDDSYGGSISTDYKWKEYCVFGASLLYSKNDSNLPALSYTNTIFSLSAKLRY